MPIGVRFIVAALVFYTIAIWSERFVTVRFLVLFQVV